MNQDYLIKKKPMYALALFALPMIIGNLFQQTYTMVDSAIVGTGGGGGFLFADKCIYLCGHWWRHGGIGSGEPSFWCESL